MQKLGEPKQIVLGSPKTHFKVKLSKIRGEILFGLNPFGEDPKIQDGHTKLGISPIHLSAKTAIIITIWG